MPEKSTMADIPPTMRALVAPKQGPPSSYEVMEMPTPSIPGPDFVLIRVHAVGMSTGFLQFANGQMNMLIKPTFPMILGEEGSGVVVATGSGVKDLKVGDEVYGLTVEKPMFEGRMPSWTAQYTVGRESMLLRKPPHLSFEDAAALAGFTLTAYQTIRRGLQLRGADSLEGLTVFIPAALSGTGSTMIQVAKNVFGAKKIITTVSTPKVPLVNENLPGMVDQVIDYKTQRVQDQIKPGSVDFAINTQWSSFDDCIPVLNPKTGTFMSITSIGSKETIREIWGPDRFPWWLGFVLDLAEIYYNKWKLRGTNLTHTFVSGGPQNRDDLEKTGEIIARGQVNQVKRVVDMEDKEGVTRECDYIVKGKGGTGKLVIRIP